MKLIFSFLVIVTIITAVCISINKTIDADITERLEKAYFEGQRDALQGDIRIAQSNDTSYKWIKSPWNSGEKPIYQP